MNIKALMRAAVAGCLFTASLLAAPLDQKTVSDKAKWLIHVDMDNFRSTKIGDLVCRQILNKKFAALMSVLDLKLDFTLDTLSSITAYGNDFEDGQKGKGVLLLKTSAPLEKDLETLARNPKLQEGGAPKIAKLEGSAFNLYALGKDAFAAPLPGNFLVVSKSRHEVESAREVLAGKAGNLASGTAFSGYPDAPKGFFFLAFAEGLANAANIPAQARIFQNADGGRLVLGENEEKLSLNLILKGKTAEVAAQMQQALQGILALVALTQDGNKELQQLAQSVRVNAAEKLVNISLSVPVGDALKKIAAEAK